MAYVCLVSACCTAKAREPLQLCEEDEVAVTFVTEDYCMVFDADANFLYTDWGFPDDYWVRMSTHKKDELHTIWNGSGLSVVRYADAGSVVDFPQGTSVSIRDNCIVASYNREERKGIYDRNGDLLLELVKNPDTGIVSSAVVLTDKEKILICLKNGAGYEIDLSDGGSICEAKLPVVACFPDSTYEKIVWKNDLFYLKITTQEKTFYEVRDREGNLIDRIDSLPVEENRIEEGTFRTGEVYDELDGKECRGMIGYGKSLVPYADAGEEILVWVNGETVLLPKGVRSFNDRYMKLKKEDSDEQILVDRKTGQRVEELQGNTVGQTEILGTYVFVTTTEDSGKNAFVLDLEGNVTVQGEKMDIMPWNDEVLQVMRGPYYGFTDIYGNWIGKTFSPYAEGDN